MKKRIEHISSVLVCDNPDCDYEYGSVQEFEMKKFINRPCPLCDDILLTLEDYEIDKNLLKTVDYINSLSDDEYNKLLILWDIEKLNLSDLYMMTVSPHKKLNVEIIKKPPMKSEKNYRDSLVFSAIALVVIFLIGLIMVIKNNLW